MSAFIQRQPVGSHGHVSPRMNVSSNCSSIHLHRFQQLLIAVVVGLLLTQLVPVTDAGTPPANFSIGCFSTVSQYGGPVFDFKNQVFNNWTNYYKCPATGCDPDARTSAFLYQIDQINANSAILPHTKLIAECLDDQGDQNRAFFVALQFLTNEIKYVTGDYFSRVAMNAAPVLKHSNIPLLSWGASNPQLSTKSLYPNFGRVCQSDAAQTEAHVAAAVSFGWTSIAMLYTDDGYGQGGAQAFVQRWIALNNSITTDQSIVVDATVDDVLLPLQRIKATGIQAILFFGHPNEMESIITVGKRPEIGLFNNLTTWLLCDDVTLYAVGPVWTQAKADGTLNGVLGFHADDGRDAASWKTWANGYMSRNVTGLHPLITVLPKTYDDINIFDSFAAEVANVAANVLHNVIEVQGNYDPTPLDLMTQLWNTNMTGLTGGITFDANNDRRGITFIVVNMQGGAFTNVAKFVSPTWTVTAPIKFPDGTNSPPPSFPLPPPPSPPPTAILSDTTSRTLIGLTVVLLVILTGFGVALVLGRNIQVFQSSSVAMMSVLLVGGMFLGVSVIMSVLTPTRDTCNAKEWLFNLGFQLMLGSMMLKTYRIHSIFNSYQLQVKALTDAKLFLGIGIIILFDSLVLGLKTGIAPYQINENYVCSFNAGDQDKAATGLSLILIITKGILLLCTTYLTYSVRNLPSRFNESTYLAIGVYNSILICIIWLAVRYGVSTSSNPSLLTVFESALMLIGTAIIACLMFTPKCIQAIAIMMGGKSIFSNRASNQSGLSTGSALGGISLLEMSVTASKSGKQKHGKEYFGDLLRTTIEQQHQTLQQYNQQLTKQIAGVDGKKLEIRSTIDLLNQLETEEEFFQDCVRKGMDDRQLAEVFEPRLKDIHIPDKKLNERGSIIVPPSSGPLNSSSGSTQEQLNRQSSMTSLTAGTTAQSSITGGGAPAFPRTSISAAAGSPKFSLTRGAGPITAPISPRTPTQNDLSILPATPNQSGPGLLIQTGGESSSTATTPAPARSVRSPRSPIAFHFSENTKPEMIAQIITLVRSHENTSQPDDSQV